MAFVDPCSERMDEFLNLVDVIMDNTAVDFLVIRMIKVFKTGNLTLGHIFNELDKSSRTALRIKISIEVQLLIFSFLFIPQEKETLQTTLSVTMDEHKTLVDRLQDMTNIHITVKESLQVRIPNISGLSE